MTIRAIIVDDEPLARARLRRLIADSGIEVEIAAEASNGEEAVALVESLHPELLFLDIQMPGLDGFDVVGLLRRPRPHVVFVTAYDQHALRAFEVHALDYLTKPVRLERLKDTLARVVPGADRSRRREHDIDAMLAERPRQPLARLALHVGRRLRVVSTSEIRWIEARDKLVFVHLAGGEHPVEFTLDELESRLDDASFLRVHRSAIVNVALVRELLPWFAGTYMVKLDDGTQLPVARRRVREVRRVLGGG
jgi:two-component system LytT family response regulator